MILENAKVVMDRITSVILERRQKDTEESNTNVMESMKQYEQLLGKLDAVLAQLTIIDPSKEEVDELQKQKSCS